MKKKILKSSEKKSSKKDKKHIKEFSKGDRICNRSRECKQPKCPHAFPHKKTKVCKQHICSILSYNRECHCVKEK